jgi:hypothetical protein
LVERRHSPLAGGMKKRLAADMSAGRFAAVLGKMSTGESGLFGIPSRAALWFWM